MRIRTMIIDDQEDIRLLMRVMIQTANAGLQVRGEAESGEEALTLIHAVDPDVVVIDQMMPGMTGIETAQAIRAVRPDQQMVMCTAFYTRKIHTEAVAAGFAACISKDHIADIPGVLREVAVA